MDGVHTLPDRLGLHVIKGEGRQALLIVDLQLSLPLGDISVLREELLKLQLRPLL